MATRETLERIKKHLMILKEFPDSFNRCFNLLNQINEGKNELLEALENSDMNERKAAIFLIVCLVGIDNGEETIRVMEYAKRLLKILTTSSIEIVKYASKAIAYLILTSKSYAFEIMETSLNYCFESLEELQSKEEKRLAAVILARDLAFFTSTQFFQRMPEFFNHIFRIIRESKSKGFLREAAVRALQSALYVTSQREAKHKNEWYKRCFNEACSVSTPPKEESLHASLLVFNEILRIANPTAEQLRLEILNIPTHTRIRAIIGCNPIEWISDSTIQAAVESRTCRALVTECFFSEILKRSMEARSSKSSQCQLILLEIYPRICSFSDIYGVALLPDASAMIDYSLQQMHMKNFDALLTLGLISMARPEELQHRVLKIFPFVTQHLNYVSQQAIKKKPLTEKEDKNFKYVMKCLSLFIRSQKENLKERIRDLLPTLFSTGISEELTLMLHDAISVIPSLKMDVLDGLLEQLHMLLMNQPRPNKLAPPTPPPIPSGPILSSNIELTKLALKTLGDFDFTRHALQMFIRYIAQGYLTSDFSEIRLASVFCCAKIIKPFIRVYDIAENPQKAEVYLLIKNVLECLIKTAVIDPEIDVRLNVIKCFCGMNTDFHYHLAQNEMLETLFLTLHDESYQVQEQAAELLGQISDLNPSFVFLKLRGIILEIISQLVNSKTPRIEEHSSRMLARLAKQTPKFMSSYMNSILIALNSVLQREQKTNEVIVGILDAISELTLIGGLEVVRFVPKIFPHLITHLHDSSSLSKREAALRAMGGICQSTCYVIDTYKEHPELLDMLLKLLRTELSASMHRLAMKVLGIIGALDPYTHKVYIGRVDSTQSKSLALTLPNTSELLNDTKQGRDDVGSDIIQWIGYERCTLTEYYPALALRNLVQMLQDDSYSIYHKEILQAVLQIFSSLGLKSGPYISQVVVRLIAITETCKPELREFFLSQFSKLASIVRLQLRPHMKQIITMIGKAWFWGDDIYFRSIVISVLEEVGSAFGTKFSPYVTDLCPYLINVVHDDQTKERRLTMQALSCVRTIASCLGTHIHLILPPILQVVDDRQVPDKVRLSAVDTIIVLTSRHAINEKAAVILQTWTRCLQVRSLQEKLMELLLIIISKWNQFYIYGDSINVTIKRCRVPDALCQDYHDFLTRSKSDAGQLVSLSARPHVNRADTQRQPSDSQATSLMGKQVPLLPPSDTIGPDNNVVSTPNEDAITNGLIQSSRFVKPLLSRDSYLVNVDNFKRLWISNSLTSREDWLQWLSTLRNQFIRQSSSAAIRACAVLAETSEALSKDLFNASFMSIWTKIRESEQDELTRQLCDVLKICPYPEPILSILNLAEFMDHSEKGPLPIDYRMLSRVAEQNRAYAKALHYKEQEIIKAKREPNAEDCQTLITLFNKLNLEEGAAGVVLHAEQRQMEISGRWYEKLGQWEKALEMYTVELSNINARNTDASFDIQKRRNRSSGVKIEANDSFEDSISSVNNAYSKQRQLSTLSLGVENTNAVTTRSELMLHQMRCLEALSQWSQLNEACTSLFSKEEAHMRHNSDRVQEINQSEYLDATLSEVAKKQKLAQMAAHGCWAIGDYEKMFGYVNITNENSQEGSFMRAVLAVRNSEFEKAYMYINKVRDMFNSQLTTMAAESYERAYGAMVLAQELTELEEAIEYKLIPERRIRILLLWSRRIQGCSRNVDHWRRILLIRSVVLSQNELRPLWIKFASICRRDGKHAIAHGVLKSLLEVESDVSLENVQIPVDKPTLALTMCKQLWADGHRNLSFSNLEKLTQALHHVSERSRQAGAPRDPYMLRIIAQLYMKLADWHSVISALPVSDKRPPSAVFLNPLQELTPPSCQQPFIWQNAPQRPSLPSTNGTIPHLYASTGNNIFLSRVSVEQMNAKKITLKYYINATTFDPNWYKAWRRLATTYYNMVMSDRQLLKSAIAIPNQESLPLQTGLHTHTQQQIPINSSTQLQSTMVSPLQSPLKPTQQQQQQNLQLMVLYAVQAVKCFFKAIQLAEGSRLDDTLRLLMLWFDYGERPEIFDQLRESIKLVPIESWLEVIPQLISHLDSQQNTGLLIRQLAIDISKVHPQALVYALTAATKSRKTQRSKVAKDILEIIAEMQPSLVEQALLINNELIRCAILWHELWHEALEDASRYYFQEKNIDEMLNVLKPLHQKIEHGHATLKEQSFNQTYYKELKDAYEHCEVFKRTGNQKEMTAAWDLYYNVFKKISNQLRQMNALDLTYISPLLAKAYNFEISVPGTYDPSAPLVTIVSVNSHMQVIMSKQRPRKIKMRGSDGREYAFLLKGHEDPRQDERVMQLFGLINSLILREAETYRRNLCIQRYSIIPLSQSSGLIGWVPNCDTLHALIRDYREKKKIPISEEHTKMQALVIDIDKLTLLQKVEVFEEALRTTPGDDLRQTLWMKSPNSEIWFDRRTNYTRSMACMSMVGYILGLGDRHPSNLMLDRLSGKIVHIDFGDCFEVAMKREKYPEKIPFRLTRMLIQAMEVTGIDGNYRLTCERVLRLLRDNNDSILAVLEAFVYDPVLNWRGAPEGPAVEKRREPVHLAPSHHPQQKTGETGRNGSEAINRVKAKLCGRDFNPSVEISVQEQVNRLIEQATLNDNLCLCYIGWCPFW